MNMKFLLSVLFSICLSAIALSQSSMQDVIYLKNGSIIRGMIIEQVPNKTFKIQTADNSIFVYEIADVEKVTKEMRQVNNEKSYAPKAKGYVNIPEIGYAVGLSSEPGAFVLSDVNGFMLSKDLSVGIGVGITNYTSRGESTTFLPVFADIRGYIGGRTALALIGDVGYAFQLDGFKASGLYINPSVGVRTFLTERTPMTFTIGYLNQTVSYNSDLFGYYFSDSFNRSNITFKVGLAF